MKSVIVLLYEVLHPAIIHDNESKKEFAVDYWYMYSHSHDSVCGGEHLFARDFHKAKV